MIHSPATRFEDWKPAACRLLALGVPPQGVTWREADPLRLERARPFFGLASAEERLLLAATPGGALDESDEIAGELWQADSHATHPDLATFWRRAETAAANISVGRWDLLYRLLWRITRGEHALLAHRQDPLVRQLTRLCRQVQGAARQLEHDALFFSDLPGSCGYELAWSRAEHRVLRWVGPRLVTRFGIAPFGLMTPLESVEWDGRLLRIGPGTPRDAAPRPGDLPAMWSRVQQRLFRPERWHPLAPQLQRPAPRPAVTQPPELPPKPRPASAARVLLVAASQHAERDGLMDGSPARAILEQALAKVGLSHQPAAASAQAMYDVLDLATSGLRAPAPSKRAQRAWLLAELEARRPERLVVLGATAAQLLFGRQFRVTHRHGQVFASSWCPWTLVTYHPAALIRVPDLTVQARMREQLLYDLHRLAESPTAPPSDLAALPAALPQAVSQGSPL